MNDFPIYAKHVVIPFYPESPETTPQLTLTVDVPVLTGPLKDITKDILYEGLEPEVYVEQLVNFHKKQYLDMKSVLEEYPDLPQASLNWEYTETIGMDQPSAQIMVISRTRDYYLGGAHGMTEKQHFVINTKLKKRLRLGDLIKADALPMVQQSLEEELRNFSEIAPADPLSAGGFFEDTVEIPENFFLTSKGLGFHWDPYEIAPYVMGPIDILIPYERLQGILTL